MGSTISVCLLDLTSGILTVGNLGDSPILLGEVNPAEPTKMHVVCSCINQVSTNEDEKADWCLRTAFQGCTSQLVPARKTVSKLLGVGLICKATLRGSVSQSQRFEEQNQGILTFT